MFGSEILDVAIGLIFMYLLLSLVTSSIKEALETVMKSRARDLERGIRELLGDDAGTGLVKRLYDHPLIDGLYQGKYQPGKTSNLPSYIPPRAFALALMDLFKPAGAQTLAGSAFATAPLAAHVEAETPATNPLLQLRQAIALSENEPVRRALLPLIDAAGNNAALARQNIEDWYNSGMDRVSGWYKRRTQQIIAGIALLVSILLNVDTVAITRYLNTSPAARAVIIEELKNHPAEPGVPKPVELANPIGWLERQGGIPVGWVFEPEPGQDRASFDLDWRRPPATVGGWLLKLAGIIFTAFAISLGAPFWFDVLNKVMVIRSTVKPQEKSQEEKSKA
jgi:hypothetical protein